MREGGGEEEGTIACKNTQIVGKKYRTFRRVNYLLPKLDDTIPRGGIHTEYFKYETSIVECIQDAALLTVTQL